jgi:aldehyde dehydrogenase
MSSTLTPTATTATLPSAALKYAITIPIKARYDNFIGGKFVAPVKGQYF